MSEILIPAKIQEAAKAGFERTKIHRRARAMFMREYVGQYYAKNRGITGETPINLIFHALRSIIPNIIMQNPITLIDTDVVPHKEYAEILGLGVDTVAKRIKLSEELRAVALDAFFGLGIMQTGLCGSNNVIMLDDAEFDPGEIYVSRVDLDDFCIDPTCTSLKNATFTGAKLVAPRRLLLDYDMYDHDLVMQLPKITETVRNTQQVKDLTQKNLGPTGIYELQDYVEIVQLWIPEANALVTVPNPYDITFDDYIGVQDYYGPEEGPFDYLALTPPVGNNPFPVAPVSLWYDLHKMANNMMDKIMNQADRQKDVLAYTPANADDAEQIADSKDGDSIAVNDVTQVKVMSYGGQANSNERLLQQVQVWFNYMSGNPDQISGAAQEAETATQAQILQANAGVGIQDMRQTIYNFSSGVTGKIAWYLHTDPLLEIPIARRQPGGEYIQVTLTPEQREGDFLEFNFTIKARSMSIIDPQMRTKRLLEFGTNLLPGAANAAMVMSQMGQQFNLAKFLTLMAEHMDIEEEMADIFIDPEFQKKQMLISQSGPQSGGKGTIKGVMQNHGDPNKHTILGSTAQKNSDNQEAGGTAQQSFDSIRSVG
ncbi:hypothetical protein LCGC14_0487380 [marine sediment metagenome]|uniref:Portal protein n=1 Tax=marine sediment metagenome TaxID=412755 RepID=A0A0F9SD07_9ZZZZ